MERKSESLADDESEGKEPLRTRRKKRVTIGAVLGFVVFVGAGVIEWDDAEGLQRRVCVDIPIVRTATQASNMCLAKFREISSTRATATLDNFLIVAGAEPAKAFNLLGGGYSGRERQKEFVNEWNNVALVERVSRVQADRTGFNRFQAKVRFYRVDPFSNSRKTMNFWERREIVDVAVLKFRLQQTDSNDVLITHLDNSDRIYGKRLDFAWATFTTDTHARRGPSYSSASTRATDVRKGSHLRVLCRSDSNPTWFLTYIGWFPKEEVRLTQKPATGMLICGSQVGTM